MLGVGYAVTQVGMLGLLALVALFRGFERREDGASSRRTLAEYVVVSLLLGALAIRPPMH